MMISDATLDLIIAVESRLNGIDDVIDRMQEARRASNKWLRDVNSSVQKVQRSLKTLARGFKKVQSALRKLRSVATRAFQALVAFSSIGGILVKLSSDTEELNDLMKDVFKNRKKDIEEFAKTTGRAMGRSIYQMKDFVTQVQATIKPLLGLNDTSLELSKTLSKLAVDMASALNIKSDKNVLSSILSGLMGETEPLKKYGLVLNQNLLQEYAYTKGIKQKISAMSESQKVMLRYAYIMENTEQYHNNARKTISSVANQWKLLKAQLRDAADVIGSMVLPATAKLLQKINSIDIAGLAKNIKELISNNKEAILDLLKYAGKVTLIISAIGLVGSAIMSLLTPLGLVSAGSLAFFGMWYINLYDIQGKTQEAWEFIKDKWDELVEKGVIDKIKGYGTLALKVALKFAGELWEDIKNDNWTNVFT
ncbi:hypothetical protein, partial [Orenia marismortui]